MLIQHCRAGQWNYALQRVNSHPEEAAPMLLVGTPPFLSPLKRDCLEEQQFEPTALLLVCCASAVKKEERGVWADLIKELVHVSPSQISARCSGFPLHYTPLHALVGNPLCTTELLQLFLDQEEGAKEAYHDMHHSDSPIHIACMYLSKGRNSIKSMELLKTLIDFYSKEDPKHRKSPDIAPMLFSLGPCDNTEQVIQVVKYSIEKDPLTLYQVSKLTSCNLLHLALRNFGDCLDVIQYLVDTDKTGKLLSETNVYGDLPLHVACTCGSSMPIWSILVANTPRNLLWTTNKAGYTCIDLEWMRHMELGRNMSEGRIYLPLPAQAFPREARLENACRDLLQQAVKQVVDSDSPCKLGTVLYRIKKLVQCAGDCNDSFEYFLHAASMLCRLPGPCLAAPLMQLFQFLYPKQVFTVDKDGRLPLHHSVMSNEEIVPHSRLYDASDHQLWVEQLVQTFPKATEVMDSTGRLALHYALENDVPLSDKTAKAVLTSNVMLLVRTFPDSIHRRLPSSGLYPFQHAATNQNFDVEVIYTLLKRDPAMVIHIP